MFVSMLIVKKGKKDTVSIVVNIRPLGKLLLEESLGKKRLKRLLQEINPTMPLREKIQLSMMKFILIQKIRLASYSLELY